MKKQVLFFFALLIAQLSAVAQMDMTIKLPDLHSDQGLIVRSCRFGKAYLLYSLSHEDQQTPTGAVSGNLSLVEPFSYSPYALTFRLPDGLTVNDMKVYGEVLWLVGHDRLHECGFLACLNVDNVFYRNGSAQFFFIPPSYNIGMGPDAYWVTQRLDDFDRVRYFVDDEHVEHVLLVGNRINENYNVQEVFLGADTTSIFADFRPRQLSMDYILSDDTTVVFDDDVVLRDYVVAVSRVINDGDSIPSMRVFKKVGFSLRQAERDMSVQVCHPKDFSLGRLQADSAEGNTLAVAYRRRAEGWTRVVAPIEAGTAHFFERGGNRLLPLKALSVEVETYEWTPKPEKQ